ncbi:MAG: M48 family metallopeptidase [Planctomycetota bacterium]
MDANSDISRRQMIRTGALGIAACGCIAGCKTAPVTGRKQMMLVQEPNEVAMGAQAFADAAESEAPTSNSTYQKMVEKVARRIAAVSGRDDYDWETRCVASEEKNAYALPGGKIVIYEGILPVCQNEAGLAVVMSHEVAHVLARHGGERMSHQMAVNGVKQAVSYVTRNQEEVKRDLWMQAYGMTSEYMVVLPYSRKHESEADHIGLMLMAEAGYDPTEAPKFWSRFAASSSGPEKPEFLSTHPADARRASDLEKLLPDALEGYRQAKGQIGKGEKLV